MGCRASLIYGVPADEVPQEWLAENGCEDVGEVWMEYGDVYSQHGGKMFTCHHQGWDGDLTRYVGYTISEVELDCADEIDQAGEITRSIAMLDKTPFNEMAEYAVIRPRLFLICSYL